VALIGPLADNPREMLGAWAVTGDPKYVVTLRTALQERWAAGCLCRGLRTAERRGWNVLKADEIYRAAAADDHAPPPDDARTIAEAVETAKQADVVISGAGESADWMEGEAQAGPTLGFTGAQEKLLRPLWLPASR